MVDRLTADPTTWIEAEWEGYIRYRSIDGRRWEVRGICDHRGNCLVGATIDGELIETIERAHELALAYSGLDVPVAPGFRDCCPLEITELPNVHNSLVTNP